MLKRYFGKDGGEVERGKEKRRKRCLVPKLPAAGFRQSQEGCKIPLGGQMLFSAGEHLNEFFLLPFVCKR